MVKSVFKMFLKDRLLLILFYIVTVCCLILFFHLSGSGKMEYMYPFSIGLFFLFVYLVIDWLRYYPANRAIFLMLHHQSEEIQPHTKEQQAFQQLLHKINAEHSSKYNEMKEHNKERIYFLSHWMHYLKTPVSVIELILSKEAESDIFNKIQHENKRLHTSIEQGLTMIRMDHFENDLEVKSIDLLTSLRKIINSRKKECIYQSIFPSIEFDGKNAYIVTDSKWNEMLLDQIIANAIKYSSFKSGNKKLVFQIKQEDDTTSLTITDEGVGIPQYDLERVFQPFFTGENGRKFPNSTGIGLYLSKKIADKLGHFVTIDSKVNEGTTVTIRWLSGKRTFLS